MKFIKNRQQFLSEAKIRDVILPRQAKEVTNEWGEKYLDYEEISATDKIKQGKWKLSEEDKNAALGTFFDCNILALNNLFEKLPDKFAEILSQSIDLKLIRDEKFRIIITDLNIKKPSLDQIIIIFEPLFRKLSVGDTNSTEIIQKDTNNRPIRDEAGNMIKIAKQKGDPVFSNNLVNINTFLEDYNRCFAEKVENNYFQDNNLTRFRNMATINENEEYEVDFKIFDKDLYLSIDHNPKDILNMSISKFYSSCQHLYGGGYREKVLSNVFDPNSIPAFLVFETPIYWDKEIISENLPLSRMMIRNLERFDEVVEDPNEKPRIYFDRSYPDRMKETFDELVLKYSENEQTIHDDQRRNISYIFTPDIDIDDTDTIRDPYMDRLKMERKPFIGVNTRTLYLSKMHDWSKVKMSKNAKIKELIIETTDIPEDLTKISLTPDWIKFKYLKINSLTNFDKIKTDSIAFDKCKLDFSVISDIVKINENIKKLQFVSCDLTGNIDFSEFKNLEELQMLYTLDSFEELKIILQNIKINSLVISGDLIKTREDRSYINRLKRTMTIKIIGPVI